MFIASGGRATVSFSVVAGNTAPALGGGILDQGTLALRNVRVTGNTALNGGGLAVVAAHATVSFSVLAGNSASNNGGAVFNVGDLSVDHSRLDGNTAQAEGGGVDAQRSTTTRISSTIVARNRAGGLGGGFADLGGTMVLTGDRVVLNRGSAGGGIATGGNAAVALRFTLVALNFPDNCSPRGAVRGCPH